MSQRSTGGDVVVSIIEKAIGLFSPRWAYERAAWRGALRSYYDSAEVGRLNSGWTTVNATAEQTDQGQRDIIRARARDLERNSDIAEGIIGTFERYIVGTGLVLQAKARTRAGEEDDGLNKEIEELFEEWAKARNCDITGQQNFYELQQMALRRVVVDGAIFFVKVYTSDGVVPFKLQAREVDELDTSFTTVSAGSKIRIVGGVELDAYNKPVAYYFKRFTPDGFWTGKSERIEAKRVIYLWRKNRPTQIREISPLARTLPRVRDVNEFVEAVSVKERILACLAVFITKNPTSTGVGRGLNATDEKSGYRVRNMTPGMIQELQPGESVSAVNPAGQSSNARDFISIQQRLAGAGQGLSYEAVSRDMSMVNYSSARQGLLEDQRNYKMWQDFLIEHLCEEVYTEFVISAVLSGALKVPDFWDNKKRYLRHQWIPPGWSWIDPLKEVKANSEALLTGQETLAHLCAQRGMDWREVIDQIAAEYDYAESVGIQIGGMRKSESVKKSENGDAVN